MFSRPPHEFPNHSPVRRRGRFGVAVLAVLAVWALLVHPRLGGEAVGGVGSANTTFSTSTSTSAETQTTSETVRIDTFATQLIATDPIGALVSDQTLPLPFADATVQAAIAAAQAALLTGPAVSLFVKGPSLAETTELLVGSSTMTVETGREATQTVTLEDTIGPGTIIIGDRDLGGVAFEVLVGDPRHQDRHRGPDRRHGPPPPGGPPRLLPSQSRQQAHPAKRLRPRRSQEQRHQDHPEAAQAPKKHRGCG